MKYRRLGKTDLKVSVVGIGTYQYGGELGKNFDENEVRLILDRGHDLGLNLIDTAECYGDHFAEALIGKAIKNKRSDWVIATKFGHKIDSRFIRTDHWDAGNVRQQLEDSLKALQTDYVDLYQFHSGNDDAFQNEELWSMLHQQVESGKIRHLAISISSSKNVFQAQSAPEVGANALMVRYNRLEREAENEIFPICIKNGSGVMVRVPLARGFLSGRYKPGVIFAENDIRANQNREAIEKSISQVDLIKNTEVPKGIDMAQWAIGWCLQHEAVSTCIPGYKNISQLESAAEASDLNMVSEEHPQAWR